MTAWLWAWTWSAVAAPEVLQAQPVAMHAAATERYRAWRASQGMEPADLVCDPLWPSVVDVCFRSAGAVSPGWFHASEVAGSARSALIADVRRASVAVVARARWQEVAGMSHRYLTLATDDGWAAAGLLRPDLLVERLGGGPIRVAMPARGLLVAYTPAGPALDRVMAVGIRELYDAQAVGLSPKVFQWDGHSWRSFGEAVPRSAP